MRPGVIHTAGQIEQAESRAGWWMLAFFVMSAFFAVVLIHDLFQSLTRQEILHITEVDPDGRVLWTGQAGTYTLNDIQVENTIQQWIEHCRFKPDDSVVQSLWKERCLAISDGKAHKLMEQYFADWDKEQSKPENSANRIRVKVKNFRRQKEAPGQFTFWWTETWAPRYGGMTQDIKMQGKITVQIRSSQGLFGPLLRVGDINRSPTGVFIVDYLFSSQEEAS